MGENAAQRSAREKRERDGAAMEPNPEGSDPEVAPDEQPDADPTALDIEELIGWLKGRVSDADKETVNAGLGASGSDEAALTYLREVAAAVEAGEPVPVFDPAAVAAGNNEEGDEQADQTEGAGDPETGGTSDVEGSAPGDGGEGGPEGGDGPTEAGPSELGTTVAAEPYADLSIEELMKLIHEEGGARAVDRIDQRIGFLGSASTLPYLRQYALAVVEDREPPVLDDSLAREAEAVASQMARDRAAVFEEDEERERQVAARAEPPPPPEVVEDREVAGISTGTMVRVTTEDRDSPYNGHAGFVIAIEGDGAEAMFAVQFHRGQEDPGSRPPELFPFAALSVVPG